MIELLTTEQRENLNSAIAKGNITMQEFTCESVQDFIPAIILGHFPVIAYYNLPNGRKPQWLPLLWRGREIDKATYYHIQRIDCAIRGRDINEKRTIWGDFTNNTNN